MTAPSTPERLAALVAHVREGWSIVRACRVLRVSQRTVWLWRRTRPEFAAALHEAEKLSADIRNAKRDEAIREQYFAHTLEMADKHDREDAPTKRDLTRRQRKLLAKLHGVNTALFPGRSPSHSQESDDPLERMGQRMTRASMANSFEERRKIKAAGLAGNTAKPQADNSGSNTPEPPADPAPSETRPKKGIARTLW